MTWGKHLETSFPSAANIVLQQAGNGKSPRHAMVLLMPDFPKAPSCSSSCITQEELESLRKALSRPAGQLSMRMAVCDDDQRLDVLTLELSAAHQAVVISIPDSVNDPVLECARQTAGAKPGILFVKGMHTRSDLDPLLQCLERSDFQRWQSHFPASTIVFWLSPTLLKAICSQAPSFRIWCVKEHILFQESVSDNVSAPWEKLKTSGLDAWDRSARLARLERRLQQGISEPPEYADLVQERLNILLQMRRFDAVLHLMPALQASCTIRSFSCTLHDLAGLAHIGLHNGTAARRDFSTALSVARELGDIAVMALENGHLALAHFALNDLASAKSCYSEALNLWEKCSNARMAQIDSANLASIQHGEGNKEHLPASYENALLAAEESGDMVVQSHFLNHLGSFYMECGQNRKALELHRRALNISNRIGDSQGACTSLMNLGMVYAVYSNIQEAKKHYLHALRTALECLDRRTAGLVSCNLAALYQAHGMIGESLEYYMAGKEMLEQIGDARSKTASERMEEIEEYIAEIAENPGSDH